jgi:hypothetical protein
MRLDRLGKAERRHADMVAVGKRRFNEGGCTAPQSRIGKWIPYLFLVYLIGAERGT